MKTLKTLTRKPSFWVIQVLLFVLFSWVGHRYYSKAFPIVDLQITMDRTGALKKASELASENHWGPEKFRQAASFELDQATQTFIELSAGGPDAFARLLKEGLYAPYTWDIRHFAEKQTNETHVRFTPQGSFYGFYERIPENAPGAALPYAQALQIAEKTASFWKVPLRSFRLVESSQETRPSHRVDHLFVYERPNEKIQSSQFGEGNFRLKLVVSGDRLTELAYFVKIPDAFSRKYAEMRSSNQIISTFATVAMLAFYIVGGCILGVFFLARKNWLLWKAPVIMGAIVALFQVLERYNQLPLAWVGYDTAISSQAFLLNYFSSSVLVFFSEFVLLSLSFMGAESLSRRAFPQHPQLWRIWRPENASSTAILGRTIGGYLWVGFFFSYVIAIYLVGSRYFGWWSPSDTLFHPDGLAAYLPWFTSISNSLHAGLWEESLFRAVPLAGAALLGARFGHRKKWIAFAFLFQALVFAAGHANYPAQPSYARVVELILPSFLFGGLYLIFGLLPGMVLHFIFDVISFSMPLFVASVPGIWKEQACVVFFALVPLWVVLGSRLKVGKWVKLPARELNGEWMPTLSRTSAHAAATKRKPRLEFSKKFMGVTAALALLCLGVWTFRFKPVPYAPPVTIDRTHAVSFARNVLEKSGVHLSSEWEALPTTYSQISDDDRFVWKTEGETRYRQLIGTYLSPPSWGVRFVRFDTDVAERAEEYQVYFYGNGDKPKIVHILPEGRKGKILKENTARSIALNEILKTGGPDAVQLKPIVNQSFKLPERKDWLFVYTDRSVPLKSGEARVGVRISGDQATSIGRSIFIPEEWSRNERSEATLLQIFHLFSTLFLAILFLSGAVLAIIHWVKKKLPVRKFLILFGGILILGVLQIINQIPEYMAHLSTTAPKIHQILSTFSFGSMSLIVSSAGLALLMTDLYSRMIHTSSTRGKQKLSLLEICFGYSLGVLSVIASWWVMRLFPQALPMWGRIDNLNTYFPLFTALGSVDRYFVMMTLLLLAGFVTQWLTSDWTQRRTLGAAFLILFGFALSGQGASNTQEWLALGLSTGGALWIIFQWILSHRPELIPMVAAAMVLLGEMRQIKLHAYVGSFAHGLLAICCVVLVDQLVRNLMRGTRNQV